MVSLTTVLATAVAMAVYCVAVPVTSTENAVKDIQVGPLLEGLVYFPSLPTKW